MALCNAFQFIKSIKSDNIFRKNCFGCKTRADLLDLLNAGGMNFTPEEFADAISVSLFKCQTENEALEVKQIEWLFNLFPEQ